ncbi:putative Mitochondrial ATP synthase subunit [Trypanosoma cruzi]|nr:putative Mitochondrial ATP synthase subunit [Trypanosoma cruzi]
MRRVAHSRFGAGGYRCISGVAPMLYFPTNPTSKLTKDEQVKRNTSIAIEMIKRYKGPVPPQYTRKSTSTIEQLEKEIDALLGGAEKMRKNTTDDQPMDKLTLMERCLRHALWSYHKEEGRCDFDQIAKWVVYTPEDEVKLAQLKREAESKKKLAAFRKRRAEQGLPSALLPKNNWAQEYATVIDREIVTAKRARYDALAVQTTECDDKQIEAVLQEYRKTAQDRRLDELVDLLERFKPVLAREAIMQRLTIKHLEGQLGVWRYMDWCPEVRDRAELEVDITGWQWWSPLEERRLLPVRLRSVNEVREIMAKAQAKKAAEQAEKSPKAIQSGSSDSARDRLLKEVLALQARINQREEIDSSKNDQKKRAHH